jgi:hypothetical protein
MSKTTVQDTRSEIEKEISGIEQARGWQCLHQVKALNGRRLIEFMYWPNANTYLIVTKDFDKPIRDGRPWPKMEAVQVFAPIDESNSWEGLNAVLDEMR